MWSTIRGVRMGARSSAVLGVVLLLGACAPGCLLPRQQRMVQVRLFFGRDIPGGGMVDDAAWADFAARVLTPTFPDGFTVVEGLGQWRNPADGQITREKSFVVEVDGAISAARVDQVSAAYRKEFHQISVGVASTEICAAF